MQRVDLVVKNARLVLGENLVEAGVAVEDGKIVAIAKDMNLPEGEHLINAHKKIVVPGLIDAHVHFRDPGRPDAEDFLSGTKAAAAGGICTVLDMPGVSPEILTVKDLETKINAVKNKAIVDFGLYGGLSSKNLNATPKLAEAGVVAFKTFLIETTYYLEDDYLLFKALQNVSSANIPCSIHAENWSIIKALIRSLQDEGRTDPMAHIASRPNFTEAEAVLKVAYFAFLTNAHVHIAHTSTKEALEIARLAKERNVNLTAETCPHYLTLTSDAMREFGPYAKVNPPLRDVSDVKALWRGVKEGIIDIIASDHAPHTKSDKDVGKENIFLSSPGMPNIEIMIPILLTKVNEGLISIFQLTKMLSYNVAKIFNLYPKKGVIAVGSDADFVIVDLKRRSKINLDSMHSKARDLNVFIGREVKGVPTTTIVRGNVVMEEGNILAEPGYGEFVRPLRKSKKLISLAERKPLES